MRAVLIVTGLVLWVSAFASRDELFRACEATCVAFERGCDAANVVFMLRQFANGLLALAQASPTWKLLAGFLCFTKSLGFLPVKHRDWAANGP